MVLKTEKVRIGDKEITVKELSVLADFRLQGKDKILITDILQECLSKEDFDYLDSLSRKEYKDAINELLKKLNELNGWVKQENDELSMKNYEDNELKKKLENSSIGQP